MAKGRKEGVEGALGIAPEEVKSSKVRKLDGGHDYRWPLRGRFAAAQRPVSATPRPGSGFEPGSSIARRRRFLVRAFLGTF